MTIYANILREFPQKNQQLSLHPLHLEDLKRSGLSDETIQLAGIRSVTPAEIKKKLGFNIPDLVSMYEIIWERIRKVSVFLQ